MIIDTSAVLAILQSEPEALAFAAAVESRQPVRMSAATWLESAVVVDANRSPVLSRSFDQFIQESRIVIEPVTEYQVALARIAYRSYGRGSGHAAHLNFGDCFAYALAVERDEELLFKGNDFVATDVRRIAGN